MAGSEQRVTLFPVSVGEDGRTLVDQESVPVCVVSEHEDPKFIQMLLNIGIVVFDVNRADIGTVIEMLKKVQVKVMDDANGKSGTEVN